MHSNTRAAINEQIWKDLMNLPGNMSYTEKASIMTASIETIIRVREINHLKQRIKNQVDTISKLQKQLSMTETGEKV